MSTSAPSPLPPILAIAEVDKGAEVDEVYFGKLNFTYFGARRSRGGLGLPLSTLAGAEFENEAPEKRYDYTLPFSIRFFRQ